MLYKRNHTKCLSSICFSLINADCFASPFEGGRGCNSICSFSVSRPPDMFSKPRKLLIFSITELSEGQFSNTGKQVEIKGNKVIMSFKYSHFMRYRSHSHSFPHVIVIALELLITGQVLIPGIQSKNVLLYYSTVLERDKKPQITAKLHQIHTNRGTLQNHSPDILESLRQEYRRLLETFVTLAPQNIFKACQNTRKGLSSLYCHVLLPLTGMTLLTG